MILRLWLMLKYCTWFDFKRVRLWHVLEMQRLCLRDRTWKSMGSIVIYSFHLCLEFSLSYFWISVSFHVLDTEYLWIHLSRTEVASRVASQIVGVALHLSGKALSVWNKTHILKVILLVLVYFQAQYLVSSKNRRLKAVRGLLSPGLCC